LLGERLEELPRRGLVHSFTGTVEEMQRLVGMGFHVGVNGCSMKTEGNAEVVRAIPLERLQIETDGPWVSLRLFLNVDSTFVFFVSFVYFCISRIFLLQLLNILPRWFFFWLLHYYFSPSSLFDSLDLSCHKPHITSLPSFSTPRHPSLIILKHLCRPSANNRVLTPRSAKSAPPTPPTPTPSLPPPPLLPPTTPHHHPSRNPSRKKNTNAAA